MPKGFEKPGKVLRLKKSLYGLPESGKNWYDEITSSFLDFGLKPCTGSSCVFYKDGLIVLLYVDDILLASNSARELDEFENFLGKRYHVKAGRLNDFLGIKIKETEQGLFISQQDFIQAKLEEYQLEDANGKWTPCDKSNGQEYSETPDPVMSRNLLWTNITRPDIAYAVSEAFAGELDGKRILRYLKQTLDYGIMYKYDVPVVLSAYCDSDWAGDLVTNKSRTGFVYMINDSPVAWLSKKQGVIALASY
jgi:hypothetical protein